LQNKRLEWFDTWLKGEDTGMADTSTPLHLFENTANRWTDTAAWPPSDDARTLYLGKGTLGQNRARSSAADTLAWAPAGSSNSLTYTSSPLATAKVLDGPSDVTVYASSTTSDTELSATLNIVAPDGTVTKQADGVLLGSQRALDPATSWYGQNRILLQPNHPFTQASSQPVTPGRSTRYDISLLSNFTRIPAGDRIQLVLTSQTPSTFHFPVSPTPQELANLSGGVYTIRYGGPSASALNLPLTSPDRFTTSPTDWGPPS
jgi:predicted acyl esterase